MAITAIEYALIRRLRELGLIKTGGSLIEFGEANSYGDVTLETLRVEIAAFAPEGRKAALLAELDQVEATRPKLMDFDLARIPRDDRAVLVEDLAFNAFFAAANQSLRALVDDVERRMDELGWDTAHIVGNSLGGWVAFELERRGRARTLTGIAPGIGQGQRRRSNWSASRNPSMVVRQSTRSTPRHSVTVWV